MRLKAKKKELEEEISNLEKEKEDLNNTIIDLKEEKKELDQLIKNEENDLKKTYALYFQKAENLINSQKIEKDDKYKLIFKTVRCSLIIISIAYIIGNGSIQNLIELFVKKK